MPQGLKTASLERSPPVALGAMGGGALSSTVHYGTGVV